MKKPGYLESTYNSFKSLQRAKVSETIRDIRIRMLAEFGVTSNEDDVVTLGSPYINDLVKDYFKPKKINIDQLPFPKEPNTVEPKHISQVKECINALYYAELAFSDIEKINLNPDIESNIINFIFDKISDIKHLYFETLKNGYDACFTLSHLGVELGTPLLNYLTDAFSLMNSIEELAHKYASEKNNASYKAGLLAGNLINTFAPNKKIDYSAVIPELAILPKYVEQLRGYIEKFSSQDSFFKQPTMNEAKFASLRKEGDKLLNSLEELQDSNILWPTKILNYLKILRSLTNLSKSTLEELANLNQSSQEVVCDNLVQLKILLLDLFRIVDCFEFGALSKPLMEKLKPIYETLIKYSSKIIDLKDEPDLLILEDEEFINLRLNNVKDHIIDLQQDLIATHQTQDIYHKFYEKLNNLANKKIIGLPKQTKQELEQYYKILEPYAKKINMDLNNNFIQELQSIWSSDNVNSLKASELLSWVKKVEYVLEQEVVTKSWQIKCSKEKLSEILVSSKLNSNLVKEQADLFLVDEKNCFNSEEKHELEFYQDEAKNILVGKTCKLTYAQYCKLHRCYAEKLLDIDLILSSYKDFLNIVKNYEQKRFDELDPLTQKKLKSLFFIFQPYLGKSDSIGDIIVYSRFSSKDLENWFGDKKLKLDKLSEHYKKLAIEQYFNDLKKTELKITTEPRENFLFKDTVLSKTIALFKDSLFNLTNSLNSEIKDALKPAQSGLPFPKVLDPVESKAEPQQVRALMQIFNSLYYAESLALELEKLNDKNMQLTYVMRAITAYGHFSNVLSIVKELQTDPYLSLIAAEIKEKANLCLQKLNTQSKPYIDLQKIIEDKQVCASGEKGLTNTDLSETGNKTGLTAPNSGFGTKLSKKNSPEADKQINPGILYPLNAFMLSLNDLQTFSQHKKQANKEKKKELERLEAHVKETYLKINAIIEASLPKALFKIPTIYKLFTEFRDKIKHFCSLLPDLVDKDLEEISAKFFAHLLAQCDALEDKLLPPGTLTNPIKDIWEQFTQGLLEPFPRKHFEVLNPLSITKRRIAAVEQRQKKSQAKKDEIKHHYTALENLMVLFDHYYKLKSLPSNYSAIHHIEEKIKNALKEPKQGNLLVNTTQRKIPDINIFNIIEENKALLDSFYPTPQDPIDYIEECCKIIFNNYLGEFKTFELDEKIASKKLVYLKDLLQTQDLKQKTMKLDYINQCIKEEISTYSLKYIGLINTKADYQFNLQNYLQQYCDEIINACKNTDDIRETVRQLLEKKISAYNDVYFIPYIQLESISRSLNQFKEYSRQANEDLSKKKSNFESEATLQAKNNYIEWFGRITSQTDLPVTERLNLLKHVANQEKFKNIMLKYSEPRVLTFAWLERLVLRFLEKLNLKKPRFKVEYQALNQTITTIPNKNSLNHYGLFEKSNEPEKNEQLFTSAELSMLKL